MNRLIPLTLALAAATLVSPSQISTVAADDRADMNFKAAALVPIVSETPARLFVDAPLPDQLALGRVVVRYRTENLRIVPVYGPAALQVSPRLGHLHVTVDDGPWRWVDASGEPLIINKFPPGPHKILIELADPTHKVITGETITFAVPDVSSSPSSKPQTKH